MTTHSKKTPAFDVEAAAAEGISVHGGLIALDALAREFGLWEKIRALRCLDPRKDTSHGYGPEVLVAQIVLSFCCGGAGLSDAEKLLRDRDPVLNEVLGIQRGAAASSLGEWLRAQTPESVDALQGLTREFIAWVLQRADARRVRRDGVLEIFFDDTQLELYGKHFEGAALNYNGDTTLSWQTLWVGPFLVGGVFGDGSRDVSEDLPALLADTRPLWLDAARTGTAHFYADSGSSAGGYLMKIDAETWGWSVSYNKWTEIPERLARELPAARWTPPRESIGRKGQAILEQFAWVRHMPGEECSHPVDFAVVRWHDQDGLPLHHYAFVAGRAGKTAGAHDPESARALFARHHLKGAREQGFSELLSDLDLHHPPCQSLVANRMWYALGMLAFDLMTAFQILHLPDDAQAMRTRSLIRYLVTVPVKLVRHAHRLKAILLVPLNWLRWWKQFVRELFPKRPRGRPPKHRSAPPDG